MFAGMSRPIDVRCLLDGMTVLFLVLVALTRSSHETCTVTNLRACLPSEMSSSLSLLETIQSNQMANLCGQLQQAKDCLDEYTDCSAALSIYRDSLLGPYRYLCTQQEGQQGTPSLSCLQESVGLTNNCRQEFQDWLSTFTSAYTTGENQENVAARCRALSRYQACISTASSASCPSSASAYAENLNSYFNCSSKGGSQTCSPTFCQNGGTCSGTGETIHCQCPSGYRGSQCQRAASAGKKPGKQTCSSSFCQNGGTCSGTGESLSCQCPSGYRGSQCEGAASGLSVREKIVAIVIPVVVVVVVAVTICIYCWYRSRRKTSCRSQEETGDDVQEVRMQKFQSQPNRYNDRQPAPLPRSHDRQTAPLPQPGSKPTQPTSHDPYIVPIPPPRVDEMYYSDLRPTADTSPAAWIKQQN